MIPSVKSPELPIIEIDAKDIKEDRKISTTIARTCKLVGSTLATTCVLAIKAGVLIPASIVTLPTERIVRRMLNRTKEQDKTAIREYSGKVESLSRPDIYRSTY